MDSIFSNLVTDQDLAKIVLSKVKKFKIKRVKINGNSISLDGYTISNIKIDQYNNIDSCDFNNRIIPIKVLKVFRFLFNEYLEDRDTYNHRTGTGLFIYYFDEKYSKLSIKYIQQMCDIDEVDPEEKGEGFRSWLVEDRYTDGGNLHEYLPKMAKKHFKRKV